MPEIDYHILINHAGTPTLANERGIEGLNRPSTEADHAMEMTHQIEEYLEEMLNAQWITELQYQALRIAIGQLQADIWYYEQMHKDGRVDTEELEYRVALCRKIINEVIDHRGMLETPAILTADVERIKREDWLETYTKLTREAYQAMKKVETELGGECYFNRDWIEANKSFKKYSYYFWQCERRLGLK